MPMPQPKIEPQVKTSPKVLPRLRINATDEEKREYIKASNGAIGWRMGKLNGKDRYDVIVNPYSSNEDYVMVLGAPPQGAAIAKGARSAYRTAKILYGQGPKRRVTIDSGMEDIIVSSKDRNVTLDFRPDPKGLTRGDIHIGQPKPVISHRMPRISGRGARITPPRPRIGR